MDNFSDAYLCAIATLAQRIYESGLLATISRLDLDNQWLWDSAVEKLPGLVGISDRVQDELNYELSFNQCCNAIVWTYKYAPVDWQHLLTVNIYSSS